MTDLIIAHTILVAAAVVAAVCVIVYECSGGD